jgi:citrate synthase
MPPDALNKRLATRLRAAGPPLYPEGDPRADEILSRLRLPSREPVAQIIAFGRQELGLYPSLELGLVALARTAELPEGAAFGLFALGRSVGWVAHALETAAEGSLIRPRARYVGPTPHRA